jgi:excisionase family DNA binding protein
MGAYKYSAIERETMMKKRKYEQELVPEGWLPLMETAKLFDVNRMTLKKWITEGRFPEPTKMGRWRLFNKDAVMKLLDA